MNFRRYSTPTLVLAAGLGLAACGPEAAKPVVAKALPAADVRVQTVKMTDSAGMVHAIGRVKNARESTIASKVMGKVSQVRVKSGDAVKAGAVLLRIDDRDLVARVEQARGALAQAEAAKVIAKQMLDRFERLKELDAASGAKHDQAVFDYNNAVGAVEQATGAVRTAESYLQESTVLAPFDGRIVDTLIEQGEMASPGMPLVRIEGSGPLEFEASVNAQDSAGITLGQQAVITVDAARDTSREIRGTVTEVVPSLDQITHTNTVRIRLDDAAGLRSGMFGRARFAAGSKSCPSVFVPADLVVRRGQLSAIYLLDTKDVVRLRLVREGERRGEEVEILSGLAEGDRVITSERKDLVDGQPGKVSGS
ncbi:efflux RND transporter periplasmic adaptor subunit [Myxococcota bacterium]|nr:efflux RND transporter periplasmic adaptor subunit [Myxococcota bacterium]